MASVTQIGSYTGTGAAINIELGWVPDKVEVLNGTDGDNKWTWYRGFATGDAIFERTVVDNGTTGNSSMALITSNGIDAYAPTDFTNTPGFTVGTALSESGKTFYYTATRNVDD